MWTTDEHECPLSILLTVIQFFVHRVMECYLKITNANILSSEEINVILKTDKLLILLTTSSKFMVREAVYHCVLITFQVKWDSVGCFCSTNCWVHYSSVEFKVRRLLKNMPCSHHFFISILLIWLGSWSCSIDDIYLLIYMPMKFFSTNCDLTNKRIINNRFVMESTWSLLENIWYSINRSLHVPFIILGIKDSPGPFFIYFFSENLWFLYLVLGRLLHRDIFSLIFPPCFYHPFTWAPISDFDLGNL